MKKKSGVLKKGKQPTTKTTKPAIDTTTKAPAKKTMNQAPVKTTKVAAKKLRAKKSATAHYKELSPRWHTIQEAIRFLRVGRTKLFRLTKRGSIRRSDRDNLKRYNETDLQNYLPGGLK